MKKAEMDTVRDIYANYRVGEMMKQGHGSDHDKLYAMAEEEFDEMIEDYREEVLKEFELDFRG